MDAELIFWIVVNIIGYITMGILWRIAKKDGENYVDWVKDGEW